TASVNHFKSKGASGLTAGDPTDLDSDQGDGQGFWNDTRTKAAIELEAWLASDPTGSGDEDVLILGDLNAYGMEDPITFLEAQGYTDLAELFVGPDAYSFVFDGLTGTLDYALANAGLLPQITGATEWHVNADEPDAIDYNLEFGRDPGIFDGSVPFRNSDHDPVIIGLDLGGPEPDDVELFADVGLEELLGGFESFAEALAAASDGNALVVNAPEDEGDVGRLNTRLDALTVIADAPFEGAIVMRGVEDLSFTLEGTSDLDVFGNSGSNLITLGDGDNEVRGGNGQDIVFGGDGNDNLNGNRDADELYGEDGNDRLNGGDAADFLSGGLGNDTLRGELGGDDLFGDEGDDNLSGGAGVDFLEGGADRDLLTGGTGSDTFQFAFGSDFDRIRDFQDDLDTIRLDATLWGGGLTVEEVLDLFGSQVNGFTFALDFGDDQILEVRGVEVLDDLANDIVIYNDVALS
ncbi:MAG: hypothetical protein AAGL98_06555, partial [Planctomycetota bacterium]